MKPARTFNRPFNVSGERKAILGKLWTWQQKQIWRNNVCADLLITGKNGKFFAKVTVRKVNNGDLVYGKPLFASKKKALEFLNQ